jgi:hypothetical protein
VGENGVSRRTPAADQHEQKQRRYAETVSALASSFGVSAGWGAKTVVQVSQDSNHSDKQKDNHQYEDESNPPERVIAPTSAMGPGGKSTNQHQDQKHNQDGSKHIFLLGQTIVAGDAG